MKVCERCGDEIATKAGENLCTLCERYEDAEPKRRARRNARARMNRRARADVMDSLGLKKVRGAMGGTYWE
jgi:uncharacterized Zn finger protein (UPF0148 family)